MAVIDPKEKIVTFLFDASRKEWEIYNEARYNIGTKPSCIDVMRNAFETLVKFLTILSLAGKQKEVEAFIAEHEMPRRFLQQKIRARIEEITMAQNAKEFDLVKSGH